VQGIKQEVEVANNAGNHAPLKNQATACLERSEEVTISCYEDEVPPFVEAEMDRLYGHINSSLSHFIVRRRAQGASTYVARCGSQALAILLFKREKGKVSVINEMIRIEEGEILRFANYIFTAYDSISTISFSFIQKDIRRLPFPAQQFNSSEDIVLTLPATPKAYLASLGKNMRRNIKRYTETLAHDFPSYRYQVYERENIGEQDVRDIINLNKTRISGKNIIFGVGHEETEWIVQLVKVCGLVGIATIEGRICGGAIAFRIGENYFMHIIGHDPKYNDYSLGILCYYLTICEGILRGGKEFHFSWGRYEYKYRLLGVQRDMASLDIYRSYKPYLLNANVVIKNAIKTNIQRTKMHMLDLERQNSFSARLISKGIKFLRKLKRHQFVH
jgi:hypothetical protein